MTTSSDLPVAVLRLFEGFCPVDATKMVSKTAELAYPAGYCQHCDAEWSTQPMAGEGAHTRNYVIHCRKQRKIDDGRVLTASRTIGSWVLDTTALSAQEVLIHTLADMHYTLSTQAAHERAK